MKRLSDLHSWQWPGHATPHSIMHLLAVPLFILAALLLLDGLLSPNPSSIAIGVIGLFAARGLERHDPCQERL